MQAEESGHQWRRAAYPLARSTNPPHSSSSTAHASPQSSHVEKGEHSSMSLRHVPVEVGMMEDPRSPYQAATNPKRRSYFAPSQASVDSDNTLYPLSKKSFQPRDELTRAALQSHRSTSPASPSLDGKFSSTARHSDDVLSSFNLAKHDVGFENEGGAQLQASTQAFLANVMPQPPSSSSSPFQKHTQFSDNSAPMSPSPAKRTLRRTSRSQRIGSVRSVSSASTASLSSDRPAEDETPESPVKNVQSAQQSAGARPSAQSEGKELNTQKTVSDIVPEKKEAWTRRSYLVNKHPSQYFTQTPEHSSRDEEESNAGVTGSSASARGGLEAALAHYTASNNRTHSVRSSTPAMAAAAAAAAAADLTNASSPPSPPPTPPEQRAQHDNRPAKQEQTGTVTQQWRSRGYPLQAAASRPGLRPTSPPTPPAASTKQEKSSQGAANEGKSPKTESVASSKKSQLSRRQGYPLQAPASAANLRPAEDGKATTKTPLGPSPQEAVKPATTYPVQSPAGTAIQEPVASKSSKQAQNKTKESSVHQPQATKETPPAKSQAFRRSAYPLQSPASINELKSSQTPSAAVPAGGAKARREAASASSQPSGVQRDQVGSQRRRSVYPVHSSDSLAPGKASSTAAEKSSDDFRIHSESTLHPIKEEASKKGKPRVVIPKNIQAYESEKPKCTGRTIVICLDGTGDKFDADNSNIVHLVSALKKEDSRQVSYYQAGIGTYSSSGLSSGFESAADMAVGSGLGLHVRDAYKFLMHSYKEGDKICIFGFSRGAYTARCLAGMVHKVGLLPPRNVQQVPFAYEFYKMDTAEGWEQSIEFKRTFSINVNVYFLGCFDSVSSVGFIPRQLPLSTTPLNKPHFFRHAMALDERRAKFKVCRHQTLHWEDIEEQERANNAVEAQMKSDKSHKHFDEPEQMDDIDEGHEQAFETDVLEVWFAGAHADVGGGAVPNVERHKLAQIPLRWMIRQAFECDTGIIFKTKVLAEHGLDVHTLWPKYERLSLPTSQPPASFLKKYETELPDRSVRRGKLVAVDEYHEGEPLYHLQSHEDPDWTPEQVEDFYDAIAPLNDQLIQAPTWWLLEMLPVEYKIPVEPGKVLTRVGMNWGQYRGVEDKMPNLHWTVQRRMQHLGYRVQARTAPQTKWRTVV